VPRKRTPPHTYLPRNRAPLPEDRRHQKWRRSISTLARLLEI